MSPRNWLYRGRQFWFAVFSRPAAADLEAVRRVLTARQMALFAQMQPSEQAHAIQVMRRIQEREENPPLDLLVAALLHDAGKARCPLRLWERVLIVLGRAIFPERARTWGERPPRGWARPFVVAAQHPGWGAEMAAGVGVSLLGQALIRRHQESPVAHPRTLEDRLLAILQAADDES